MNVEERRARNAATHAAWVARNRERAREIGRQTYARNREAARASGRARYAAQTPEQREAKRALRRAHDAAHPGFQRPKTLRWFYGLTVEQYDAMLAAQGGVCAICRRPERHTIKGQTRPLAVDHDHSCCPGKRSCGRCVRGLLCFVCNTAIGKLGDDLRVVRAALVYLGTRRPG